MNLSELQKECHQIAVDHGWWDSVDQNLIIPNLTANTHAELSEMWEEHRMGRNPKEIWISQKGKPEGVPTEMADAIIRLMDTAEYLGIDLERAIKLKMNYNRSRSYRHGNKIA